ncbi:MAG: bifunctional UDP-sugar hydrolase/5'-nucleotidase [Eubacteriales bacterium]|nr:bifunctional UDP-sugar hydrolase/5'-nucleotidase [Eubacteriales bacterium]
MKNMKKMFNLIVLLLTSIFFLFVITAFGENITDEEKAKKAQILFTHDMHSHLDPYKVKDDDSVSTVGGLARLKTLADEKRKAHDATFLVDGGDFSMGTLYQTIYETEAAELIAMGLCAYDATTFGNHEFDYRSQGIANMLNAAILNSERLGIKLPEIVSCNIDWNKNVASDNMLVKNAMEDYGCKPYIIVERGGVRAGIFGVLGRDAEACAPESGIHFEDIVESSRKTVEALKKEGAELIICLSHSGTFEDKDKSEDEILAKEVPDIDVIISGHTHTKLDEPIYHGETCIVSAGSYGENLGEILLSKKENGRWQVESYKLNRLDESISEDEEIAGLLDEYKEKINEFYLSDFGYTFDQVIAHNDIAFTQMDEFAEEHEDDALGNLIADSYVYAVMEAEGDDYEKVYVTVSPSGTIRDTIQKGDVTVSDVFNVSSLGIGPDRIPGYPLVSVYLTGRELKTAAEIDVSISPIMTTAQLYPSGLKWIYNPHRMFLNKVTDVELVTNVPHSENPEIEEIEDDKLYRVVAGLYSAQMLGAVEDSSMGLLSIVPKDKEGNPIEDFEKHIVRDANGKEVKEWYALASYLDSFSENAEGVSEVPEFYQHEDERKLKIDSRNILEIIKKPNKFAWMFYGIITVIIGFIGGAVAFFIKKRKKR